MKTTEEIILEIEERVSIIKEYVKVAIYEMGDVNLAKTLGSRYVELESLLDWIKSENKE